MSRAAVFITQPPDLRRLTLGHKSFAVSGPLALVGTAFCLGLVHRLMTYAPRFLPALGRPHAVALHFAHCDQHAGGLAPPGVRPSWAHQKKATSRWLWKVLRRTSLETLDSLSWQRARDLTVTAVDWNVAGVRPVQKAAGHLESTFPAEPEIVGGPTHLFSRSLRWRVAG